MSATSFRHFGVFFDKYYWQTAVLIARNGLARQYRNSFLGILWTLLQPLTMICVYTVIMPMIMRFPTLNYPLYIAITYPLWTFFNACLVGSTNSILSNGETLKRTMISSTVFPIADVLRNTYTFMISFLTMYTVATLIFSHFNPLVLLLPFAFLPVLMIMGAMAIAIAFIAPYIRDIGEFILVSMNILFWLTPVVYPVTVLPEQAQQWMRFNPFYIMLRPIQLLAYDHTLPSLDDITHLGILTGLSVLFGFEIFRFCRRNYVYYL